LSNVIKENGRNVEQLTKVRRVSSWGKNQANIFYQSIL
jgi:hypothetical protein